MSIPTEDIEQTAPERSKAEKIADFTEAFEFITDPEWLPWFEANRPETMKTLREIASRVAADEPAPKTTGRYQPSTEEQAAIGLLTLAGYKVVRAKTYENLTQKVRDAEWQVEMAQQDAESSRRWARTSLAEERRMSDRLNEVCFAAAASGVSIFDINTALDKAAESTETRAKA